MLREDSETTKLWWGNSLRPHALKWLTNLGLLIFHVSHLLAEEVKLSGKPVHINEDQQYFRSLMKLTCLPNTKESPLKPGGFTQKILWFFLPFENIFVWNALMCIDKYFNYACHDCLIFLTCFWIVFSSYCDQIIA